jgi:PPOX class probable F420-dependent enzyme
MILITFRRDGSPQSSPVTGGVDAAGRIVIASYPQRAKSINVRHRPSAGVLVLSDDFNGPYVQVDGDAEVLDLPDAVEPLVGYYRAIAGEHPVGPIPPSDDRPTQVPDPGHATALGTRGDRRLPAVVTRHTLDT